MPRRPGVVDGGPGCSTETMGVSVCVSQNRIWTPNKVVKIGVLDSEEGGVLRSSSPAVMILTVYGGHQSQKMGLFPFNPPLRG